MSDYIEREAAYQFFKDQLEEETGAYSKGRNAGLRVAMSAVMNNDAIPAADVRPVVTCIECKYSCDMPGGLRCCYGNCVDCYVDPEYFCADGEKREES